MSFGNTITHELISSNRFDYNWGNDNEGPYAATPGASIAYPGDISPENDVATVLCGDNWRIPTSEMFVELFDNCDFIDAMDNVISDEQTNKIISMDNVNGIRLRSRLNGAIIFFPCTGFSENLSILQKTTQGAYWARSLSDADSGYALGFSSSVIQTAGVYKRFRGIAVRPVYVP